MKQHFKNDPTTMTEREFRQFLVRKLEPCPKQACYDNALVLVSYPKRWCVCERCGTHYLKPELPQPGEPEPVRYMTAEEKQSILDAEFAAWLQADIELPIDHELIK